MKSCVKFIGSALIGLTIIVIPYLTCCAIRSDWHPFFIVVLLTACVLEGVFVAALAYERIKE